jgi:uncharacterized repeat protein (TIGR01451 family)
MRRVAALLAIAALFAGAPAAATDLTITKTATVVSDPVNTINPKAIPGAVVDYRIVLTNPIGNTGKTVKAIVFEDPLPANVILRVSDLGTTGSGPVEFTDGGILGLLGSGLTLSYTSLSSTTDGLEFYDGTSWSYVPVPDADGYDANVRAIRVKPLTTFTVLGSFQLRFRVKVR